MMELREWLLGLLGSGVLGYAGFAFVAWLESRSAGFALLEAWAKRLVAWAVSAVAGAVPYLLMVLMRYEPVPADWRGWVERLFFYIFIALSTNQAAHAIDKTRADKERRELAWIEALVPTDVCNR
jgi:hypothetical protein